MTESVSKPQRDLGVVAHDCNSDTQQLAHTPMERHTPRIFGQHRLALMGSQGGMQSWVRRERGMDLGGVGGGRVDE